MTARHWLVVHESADDGLEIEHPDCPTRPGTYSSPGHEYVQYACAIEEAWEWAGLPWRHRGTPASGPLDHTSPVAPGRYPIAYVADDVGPAVVLAEELT